MTLRAVTERERPRSLVVHSRQAAPWRSRFVMPSRHVLRLAGRLWCAIAGLMFSLDWGIGWSGWRELLAEGGDLAAVLVRDHAGGGDHDEGQGEQQAAVAALAVGVGHADGDVGEVGDDGAEHGGEC